MQAVMQSPKRYTLREQFDYVKCCIRISKRKLAVLAATLVCINGAATMAFDLEWEGAQPGVGIRMFRWTYSLPFIGRKIVHKQETHGGLFPRGVSSVSSAAIRQGKISDCNFLATVGSYIETPGGAQRLHDMIDQNPDGSFTVTFPGSSNEPITVSPLSQWELWAGAHATTSDGTNALWLPVLESAYGQARNKHQSMAERVMRTVKHGILEARWQATTLIPAFGAAFGAKDEEALRILTGHHFRTLSTTNFELGQNGLGMQEVTWRQLRSWFGRQAVEREFYAEQGSALSDAFAKGKVVVATTEVSPQAEQYGLHSGHAYSVLRYNQVSKRITVRDPYGPAGTEYSLPPAALPVDGLKDGISTLTLPEFNRLFCRLRIES